MNNKMQTNLKYRLIKKFPLSPEVGAIANFTNTDTITDFGSLPNLKQEDCQDSEYWDYYVMTTNDGIDVFTNENHRRLNVTLYGFVDKQVGYQTYHHSTSFLVDRPKLTALFSDEKLAKELQTKLELEEKTGQSEFRLEDLVFVKSLGEIGKICTLNKTGIDVLLVNSKTENIPYKEYVSNELRHLTPDEQVNYHSNFFTSGDTVQWFKLGEFTVDKLVYNEDLQTVCIKGFYKNEDCSSIDPVEAPVKECFKKYTREEKEMGDELRKEIKVLVENITNKYNIDTSSLPRLMGTVADLIKLVSAESYKVKGECEVSFDDGPSDL